MKIQNPPSLTNLEFVFFNHKWWASYGVMASLNLCFSSPESLYEILWYCTGPKVQYISHPSQLIIWHYCCTRLHSPESKYRLCFGLVYSIGRNEFPRHYHIINALAHRHINSSSCCCFLFNYIARVTSRHNNQLMDQITDCWVGFPLKHNNVILITETETSPPASLLYFT